MARSFVKSSKVIRLAIAIALIVGLAWWWSASRRAPSAITPPLAGGGRPARAAKSSPAPGNATLTRPNRATLSAAEKQARVEQIKKDYNEVRAKAAAEYSAAGANFPGGLNAFLRQLALLERELHNDLAAVLEPRELEDLEMRDTNAGQMVQRTLGGTAATEEQRREVFRLYRGFENEFALTFDLSAPALLARERARLATQEKVRSVLGDELFGSWLQGEGAEFGKMKEFVARHGLPADAALNLWAARNDLTLRRLELKADPNLSAQQLRQAQELLTRQAEARVLAILGAGALETARQEAQGWLPRQ